MTVQYTQPQPQPQPQPSPQPHTQPSLIAACAANSQPQTRILFALAGTFTLVGTLLGAFASKWFLLVPVLVSANQLLMAARGWCPLSLLLTHLNLRRSQQHR
jgi:hypothetical protein